MPEVAKDYIVEELQWHAKTFGFYLVGNRNHQFKEKEVTFNLYMK